MFPEFNIRLYDKNSESDWFFFPPPKSEYFFQQHWESEYFLEKKHTPPPPFKLNSRSLTKSRIPKNGAIWIFDDKSKLQEDAFSYSPI